MTISKSRGATRKLGPISLGSKVVRFKVSNLDRRFTVHEDLICCTSLFFKNRLQKHRKTLSTADECCVCADPLNPNVHDITYCVKCGQNVHETCIEQWKRTSVRQGGGGPGVSVPTCPMCRASWKNEPIFKCLGIEGKLDAEAVQTYLDWLYTGSLHIDGDVSTKTDAFNVALLKAWEVASAVEDSTFKHVVIWTFFNEAKARFWTDTTHWAFVERKGTDEIRDFVIEVFMAYMEPGWFGQEGKKWLGVFVSALADKALEGMRSHKSYADLKREWLAKIDGEDEQDMDDDTIKGIMSDHEPRPISRVRTRLVLTSGRSRLAPTSSTSARQLRSSNRLRHVEGSLEPTYISDSSSESEGWAPDAPLRF